MQQWGSSVGMLDPPMLLPAPQIQQGLNHEAREELELGSTRLFQLTEAARYFWHTWAPRAARGSAPSRSSGTSQAVPGGGDASVAAFPERCWHGGRLFWEWRGKCLPGSGAASLCLRAALRGLFCVAAEEPPGALERGLGGTGEGLFWDAGRKLRPSLEMLLADQRRNVPQPRGRNL